MDIANSLDRLSSKLDNLDNNGLLKLLSSLENMIIKTRDILQSKNGSIPPSKPHPPTSPLQTASTTKPTPTLGDLFSYSSQPLQDSLMTRVHEHVKGLHYHPNAKSPNSPEIFLYGEHPYEYNRQSSELPPTPILSSLPMAELLVAVNGELGTYYNSMLINRYKNLHCYLGPHKDDEKSLDTSSPISAITLGATRRFQIGTDKNTVTHTVNLESRSLCTMFPGFQEKYYHSIAPGRKSIKKEKGVRYSITFRRILADKNAHLPTLNEEEQVEDEEQEEEEEQQQQEISAPDTLVFGSSLTKELDGTLLSKYNRKFKVYSHSGARVKDISNDIKRVGECVDSSKVTSVFLVCGGNDVGNLTKDSDIEDVYLDYENLAEVTKAVFPAAKINIVSLIPRNIRYKTHVHNMCEMNKWLDEFSHEHSFRFVNIFSHFLIFKSPHSWSLNRKLFNSSNIHFNKIGNSVLAKVLIGVANRPH